jgi:hypothetical protein
VAGLKVDSTGRVHLIIDGVSTTSTGQEIVYATCAANCTSVASWTFTDLSSLSRGANPINTASTVMVGPNGQVSFFTDGQVNSYPSRYYSCATSCSSISNWSAAPIINGNALNAVLDPQGVTHVVYDPGNTSAGDGLLYYARCASNCGVVASWQFSTNGFLTTGTKSFTGFAVTASGRVFLTYNQGNATVSTADNRKLFVNSCAGSTCLDLNTWNSFSLGALDDGDEGAWLEASGEGLVLANTSSFDLILRSCTGSCQNAASWSAATVADSAASIAQAIAPDLGSSCPNASSSASWWPHIPRVAISANGVAVVHNPYAIVACPGNPNPSSTPTIGRLISSF